MCSLYIYISPYIYSLYYTLKVWVVINVLCICISDCKSKAKVRKYTYFSLRSRGRKKAQKLVWNLTSLSVQRHCMYLTENRKKHRQNQPVHLHRRERLITPELYIWDLVTWALQHSSYSREGFECPLVFGLKVQWLFFY